MPLTARSNPATNNGGTKAGGWGGWTMGTDSASSATDGWGGVGPVVGVGVDGPGVDDGGVDDGGVDGGGVDGGGVDGGGVGARDNVTGCSRIRADAAKSRHILDVGKVCVAKTETGKRDRLVVSGVRVLEISSTGANADAAGITLQTNYCCRGRTVGDLVRNLW